MCMCSRKENGIILTQGNTDLLLQKDLKIVKGSLSLSEWHGDLLFSKYLLSSLVSQVAWLCETWSMGEAGFFAFLES